MDDEQASVPFGFCRCGCGGRTPIAKRNRYDIGHVKGEPIAYIRGHNGRTGWAPSGFKVCSACKKVLPRGDFTLDPAAPQGVRPRCRRCQAEATAAYRAANPDKVRALARRRRLDPQKNRARVKAWRRANRDRRRAQARREAHARRLAPYTDAGWEYAETVLRFDPCSYCGEPAGTIDHIDAVDVGGDGDWPNLTAACLSCNSGKGNRSPLEYLLTKAVQHEAGCAELQAVA